MKIFILGVMLVWMPMHAMERTLDAALRYAAVAGDVTSVRMLIAGGVDVHSDKSKALYLGASSGKLEVVQLLLAAGADVHAAKHYGGFTVLHTLAASNGNPEIINIFLEHGMDINNQMIDGWTPLHVAVYTKRPAMVEALLAQGADMTIKNSNDKSAYDLACEQRSEQREECEEIFLIMQDFRARMLSMVKGITT